jgi:hypothetical protein
MAFASNSHAIPAVIASERPKMVPTKSDQPSHEDDAMSPGEHDEREERIEPGESPSDSAPTAELPDHDSATEAPDSSAATPIMLSAPAPPEQRLNRIRNGLTSRAAGWVVAAILAGAVVALSFTVGRATSAARELVVMRSPVQLQAGPIQVLPGGPVAGVVGPGGILRARICLPSPAVIRGSSGRKQVRVVRPASGRVVRVCLVRPAFGHARAATQRPIGPSCTVNCPG